MVRGVYGLTTSMNYITLYSVKYSQPSAKYAKYIEHETYGWTDTTTL